MALKDDTTSRFGGKKSPEPRPANKLPRDIQPVSIEPLAQTATAEDVAEMLPDDLTIMLSMMEEENAREEERLRHFEFPTLLNFNTRTSLPENRALADKEKRRIIYDFIASNESKTCERGTDFRVRPVADAHFYFCNHKGLTVGHGTKIDVQNGQVHPDDEKLKLLTIYKEGEKEPLNDKRKKELVAELLKFRSKNWDSAKHPKWGKYTVPPESARYALETMADRLAGQLPEMPNLFTQTLLTDTVYRSGVTGIHDKYPETIVRLGQGQITEADANATKGDDRKKMRTVLMKLYNEINNHPFDKNATPEQRMIQLKALSMKMVAMTVKEYKDETVRHDNPPALRVSLLTQLAMVQMGEAAAGRPLSKEEVASLSAYADKMVYEGFYTVRNNQDFTDGQKENTILRIADRTESLADKLLTHMRTGQKQLECDLNSDRKLLQSLITIRETAEANARRREHNQWAAETAKLSLDDAMQLTGMCFPETNRLTRQKANNRPSPISTLTATLQKNAHGGAITTEPFQQKIQPQPSQHEND